MILEDKLKRHVDDLISRYPKLKEIEQQIIDAYLVLEECYSHNGKLLIAGNGGSAADAEHIAGELMKRFKTPRPIDSKLAGKLIEIDPVRGKELAKNLECSLMAIPLVAHEALTTAYINDVDGLGVFAQQLFGFGREGDVFLGISTSGNSKNIMSATVVARALGIKVIGLTGNDGGELASVADVAVGTGEYNAFIYIGKLSGESGGNSSRSQGIIRCHGRSCGKRKICFVDNKYTCYYRTHTGIFSCRL